MKVNKYRLSYFIGQGFKGLWDNRMMSLASIFLLMFCLNILGAFALLIYNINLNLDKLGDLNIISAYVEPNVTYEEGESVLLPSSLTSAQDSSVQFLGWSTDPTATKPQFPAGGSYSVKSFDSVSGVITLYAIWSDAQIPDGVTATYNASGIAISDELPFDATVWQVGDSFPLPPGPVPRYADISFYGWSTDPDAVKGMAEGEMFTVTEEDIKGGKIILYAIWSEKTTYSAYEIVYDGNGHAVSGELPTDEKVRLATIEAQIRALNNISEVTLISKEEALQEEIANLGDHPELIEDLLAGDNPYPDMFSIAYTDNALVDNLEYQLVGIEGIYKVDCRSDYAEGIESIKNGVILVFVWFLAIIFLFSVLIIINTVKLTVYSRKDEIMLMSYIGATHTFISLPYVFEGILIGLISGTIAFFTEQFLYGRVQLMLTTDFEMITVVPFDLFGHYLLVAFLVIGVFTGVVGSCISLRKYMDA